MRKYSMMKNFSLIICSILLIILLVACSADNNINSIQTSSVILWSSSTEDNIPNQSSNPTVDISIEDISKEMVIELITENEERILFELNNSSAAQSFYQQLPLSSEIENYNNKEKIFYPPQKLDVSNTPMAQGPAGTLAYYEPWGNVAIYYGDFGGASGLYQLGKVILGEQHISQMSGIVHIRVAGDSNDTSTPPNTSSSIDISKPSIS